MNPREIDALVERIAGDILQSLSGRGEPGSGGICPACGTSCDGACAPRIAALVRAGVDRCAPAPEFPGSPAAIAAMIDHTLLKPEATESDIDRHCDEALAAGFATVCVNPVFVERCSRRLQGSRVRVCSVVGFPLGAALKGTKAEETRAVRQAGAEEIDMVLPVGLLRSGRTGLVEEHVAAVVAAAGADATVKVILETCLLDDGEKRTACRIAVAAGAHFVKTSTGFGRGGATVADVLLMRREIGGRAGVKASGGIRSLEAVRAMLAAGATRIGTSAGVRILREAGA